MGFWIGILAGGVFAWFAVKMKFYESWITFINIIISIYLAVYLLPIIKELIPAAAETLYGNALTILVSAVGFFLVLHVIAYVFFTSQFNIQFPKLFEILGAGFLGLLAGFLVWCFVSFLISITPVSQNVFVKDIGFVSQFRQVNMPYMSWWCNLVNSIVSYDGKKNATEEIIEGLLDDVEKRPLRRKISPTEPNEPAEPNVPTTAGGEQKSFSTPAKPD